ncbi:putative iron/copper transporter Atx1 [Pyronema omphalodes]|nr:putative iron/copper transporter Atx1 [Pyronema omphalodes]
MAQSYYEFEVAMSCGGCSGAVERVLKKLDGVVSYKTNLATQKVNVTTEPTLTLEKVEEVIKKTGKAVKSAKQLDDAPEGQAEETKVEKAAA